MIKAAEAQRNVVIQLSLVANPKNESVAGKMIKTFAEIETAAIKAAKAAADIRVKISEKEVKKREQFNNELLNSINRLGEESLKETQETNKKVVGQLRKITKRMKKIWESLEDAKTDKTKKESDKREKCLENEAKASEKLKAAYKKQIESQQKATEAGLAALQGVMDLTEGLANLGLMSDENFKKFEQGFQKIEAGYKALKGFTELVWKGREALASLNEATRAQATANALLSASNTRVAATEGAAAVAGGVAGGAVDSRGAVGEISSEVGGALGAKFAGGGGLSLGAVAGAAATATAVVAAGLALHEGLKILISDLFGASEKTETLTGAVIGWKNAADSAAKSAEDLHKAEEAKQRKELQRDLFTERAAQEAGYRSSARGTAALQDRVSYELGGGSSNPLDSAERTRIEALREVKAAEQELAEYRKTSEEQQANREFESAEEQLRVTQQMEEANRNLIDADLQRLSVLRDQKKIAEDQIKASKDAIKAAEDAQKSVHQRFAELSGYKQERLKDINSRRQAGEQLSERDIRFLEQTPGFGSDIVRDYRAQQGIAAGSGGVAAGLGDGFRDAQQAEVEARKQKQDAEARKQRGVREQNQVKSDLRAESMRQDELTRERIAAQQQVDDDRRQKQVEQNRVDNIPESKSVFGHFKDVVGEYTSSDSITGSELHRLLRTSGAATAAASFFLDNSLSQEAQGKEQNPQQKIGNATDQVTQSGVGVEQALLGLLDAVYGSNERLKEAVNNSELMRGYYSP
ncbi:Chromosome partition protein Smc [Gimesia chilikensis]|nr:Chromosome partition protein Smc [Gimesia chilikensis]